MTIPVNLKEIEQRAFRSTYQDGLWDVYFGVIVICMAVFIYRPATGYGPLNILLMVGGMALAYAIFWAGKKFITLPRMGQVKFGPQRKQRRRTMVIILSAVVLIQVLLLAFQFLARENPELSAWLDKVIPQGNRMDMLVATLGALMVGPSMIVVAYFIDFPRGYFIAILIALAVFLMIYLNRPIYPIIIGMLIMLPGLVLFVRFIHKYPLRGEKTSHDQES